MTNEVYVTTPKDFSLTEIEVDTLAQANEEWERSAALSRDYLKAHHYKDRAESIRTMGKAFKR